MSEIEKNFNNLFSRPPNFCEDCGDLLDFEIVGKEYITCQRCDGQISIVSNFIYKINLNL